MSTDKQLNRIEAKLDALLQKNKIDPAEFGAAPAKTPSKPVELTAAQKQAIANAPVYKPARDEKGKPIGDFTGGAATPPAEPPKPEEPKPEEPKDEPEPLEGYGALTIEAVLAKCAELDDDGRARVLDYERKNKNRTGIVEPLVNWNSGKS